jgi:hypothetical protein
LGARRTEAAEGPYKIVAVTLARLIRPAVLTAAAAVVLSACSMDAMKVSLEATDAASTVFKKARDEGRIARDKKASHRLGELCGSGRLTAADVEPLKRVVAEAKADGSVTLEEADRILVEMERIVDLHRP